MEAMWWWFKITLMFLCPSIPKHLKTVLFLMFWIFRAVLTPIFYIYIKKWDNFCTDSGKCPVERITLLQKSRLVNFGNWDQFCLQFIAIINVTKTLLVTTKITNYVVEPLFLYISCIKKWMFSAVFHILLMIL